MLKIGQNWGKIANYLPQYSTKIGTPGHGGTRNLFQCGSNELGEDKKKKKVFSSKMSTNSDYRLKIVAIFHEFLSEDQKNKTFVLKVL